MSDPRDGMDMLTLKLRTSTAITVWTRVDLQYALDRIEQLEVALKNTRVALGQARSYIDGNL